MAENRAEPDAHVLVSRDEVDPAVAVLTLNRPQQRNSMTLAMKEALVEAVASVGADTSVRAVVLTGTGPAFCVGQDLREHAEAIRSVGDGELFDTVERHYNPVVLGLTGMPKPVVGAINGACVGAGLGFAMACDLRVAAAGATFATAFAGIGLTADSGLSATLVHSVGVARATELLMLGERFSAEQAGQWGLVRSVVPAEEVLGVALELARTLAAGPTAAYAEIKRAVAIGAVSPMAQTLAAEAAGQARLGRTADHRGAVEAFLAKQRPKFAGS